MGAVSIFWRRRYCYLFRSVDIYYRKLIPIGATSLSFSLSGNRALWLGQAWILRLDQAHKVYTHSYAGEWFIINVFLFRHSNSSKQCWRQNGKGLCPWSLSVPKWSWVCMTILYYNSNIRGFWKWNPVSLAKKPECRSDSYFCIHEFRGKGHFNI